ncbi:hypothetical protein C7H84_10905 [Burkholderia sp. Nafp2/4-1b]|nr:hypothetical protein C7H84_10905 [Burkholderia sp. Nafp2/4-1b]
MGQDLIFAPIRRRGRRGGAGGSLTGRIIRREAGAGRAAKQAGMRALRQSCCGAGTGERRWAPVVRVPVGFNERLVKGNPAPPGTRPHSSRP